MVENNYKYLTFPKIGPCSIVFERIRGVNRYYLTINLDGEPFKKYGLDADSIYEKVKAVYDYVNRGTKLADNIAVAGLDQIHGGIF